jgi:hypothetical protein
MHNLTTSHRRRFYGTLITLCSLNLAIGAPEALAKPVDNYIGGGVRAGLNDDTTALINAKVKITDLGDVTLSGRPAVLFGDETEFRLAITGEGEIAPDFFPFFGGGVALNTDGTGDTRPLVTAGLDFKVSERFVLQFGGNVIFKSNDTDAELTATVNYSF